MQAGNMEVSHRLQQSLFALNALPWPASDTVKLKEVYAMFAQNAQRHAGRPRMGPVWRDQTEACRLFHTHKATPAAGHHFFE